MDLCRRIHDRVLKYIKDILLFVLICATLYGIDPKLLLPNPTSSATSSWTTGCLYPFVVIFFTSYVGGEVAGMILLPKVLGMIVSGVLLTNLTDIHFNPFISSILRNIALATILMEGGLGLDPQVLGRTSGLCLRLCFVPLITDTVVTGLLGNLILGLPYVWSFMLGFILSAACAAIIVPYMTILTKKNLGVSKGIPSVLLAAASMDDVIAIAGFGVMLGFAFPGDGQSSSSTGSLSTTKVWDLAKGPTEIILGIAIGFFYGNFIGLLPLETLISSNSSEYDRENFKQKSREIKLLRVSLLLFGGLSSVFISEQLDLGGVGPLSALMIAFFAGLRFRKIQAISDLTSSLHIIWILTKPFLFGLIGAEVEIKNDSMELGYHALYCLIVVVIGMFLRVLATYLSLFGGNLTWKEKLYVALAWLSKAAVQATVGPIALDMARKRNLTPEISYGRTVLLVSVIAILLSAPLGTFCMSFLSYRCLAEPPPSYIQSTSSIPEIRVTQVPVVLSIMPTNDPVGPRNCTSCSTQSLEQ